MNKIFGLDQKRIIISGASSGIGRACAVACAQLGAKLVLFGRNNSRLEETLNLLVGSCHHYYAFDITDNPSLNSVLALIKRDIGPIDGFIHSAGIQKTLPFKLTKSDVFIKQYQVNVLAGFEICRLLLKKKQLNPNGASFVMISSINGVIGAGAQIAYSASKGALISAVRSLAVELASSRIRINSISPGMVEGTPMTKKIINMLSTEWESNNKKEYPLGWVDTEDVANAAVFLLSPATKKITGTNIIVDGGYCAK